MTIRNWAPSAARHCAQSRVRILYWIRDEPEQCFNAISSDGRDDAELCEMGADRPQWRHRARSLAGSPAHENIKLIRSWVNRHADD